MHSRLKTWYTFTTTQGLWDQNRTLTDEVAIEWYQQNVVSKDSDLGGLTYVNDEDDILCGTNILQASMEGMFSNSKLYVESQKRRVWFKA
jgi:hypothetical protein